MLIQPETRRRAAKSLPVWIVIVVLLPAFASAPGEVKASNSGARQVTAQPSLPGASIFASRCAVCHGDQGQGRSALVSVAGPSLLAEHDLNRVLRMVHDGRGVMPGFAKTLRPGEIRDVSEYVAAHLATIPLHGGNVAEGGDLYRMYCASCHRTAAGGGALAWVGTNAPELTNKSPEVVAGAIRWGPGPMPAFPPSVLNDQQLASIVDYVGAVQHPPDPGGQALHWYGPSAEGFVACALVLALGGITMWIEKGGRG